MIYNISKIMLLTVALISGAAAAHAETSLPPAACQLLTKHQPAPDVAFQPGIASNGVAVAPADLPSNDQFQLPQTIKIPLTVDIKQRLGLPANTPLMDGGQLGVMELNLADGSLTFNGQPLSGQQQKDLATLCK